MENEERIQRIIKGIYTEIMKKTIDRNFSFPEGDKMSSQLSQYISKFAQQQCAGSLNYNRITDYIIFQIHRNSNGKFQNKLAYSAFGSTAMSKYKSMSSKSLNCVEDKWLDAHGLNRVSLYPKISNGRTHPLAKFSYMPSEDHTKERYQGTGAEIAVCSSSTLMWSPLSPICRNCKFQNECKDITEKKYPEIFRLRVEENGKR